MKIRINDRPDIQEIEVIINCVADDPLVNKIISALNTVDAKLLCRRQGETFQLGLADILYIESVDRKTFLYTEEQVYETDRRLLAPLHRCVNNSLPRGEKPAAIIPSRKRYCVCLITSVRITQLSPLLLVRNWRKLGVKSVPMKRISTGIIVSWKCSDFPNTLSSRGIPLS